MNCEQARLFIHALVDNELDAVNAAEVEAHVASCPDCAEELAKLKSLRAGLAGARLKELAPAQLRARIDHALPGPEARTAAMRDFVRPSRRTFIGGFAAGTALSGAIAASLVLTMFRRDHDLIIANEVVSAHIRSLQAGHLTDVETSDRHTVKPWFNGRLDLAPPVIDLTALGFTLIGGRLDYIDGEPVASVVYRRRKHVINLFVSQHRGARSPAVNSTAIQKQAIQGYNVRHWLNGDLDFWAVSDLAAIELDEFVTKISAANQAPPT
jgi:anti-sigma factor RsiW